MYVEKYNYFYKSFIKILLITWTFKADYYQRAVLLSNYHNIVILYSTNKIWYVIILMLLTNIISLIRTNL